MIRLFAYFTCRHDPVDALIAAKGARVRFTGFDPKLREQTEEKRAEAERLKRAGRRVESGPVAQHRLRRLA